MSNHIIYEKDHENRAIALQASIGGTIACIDRVDAKNAPTLAGVDRLIFWGHGTSSGFCRKNAVQFTALARALLKKNSGITMLDLFTCNISHKGWQGTPFIKTVISGLGFWDKNVTFKGVTIRVPKAMTAPNGKDCDFSILLWCPTTQTWAYVAAVANDEADKNMWAAANMVKSMKLQGGADTFPRAVDQVKALREFRRDGAFAKRISPKNDNTILTDYEDKFDRTKAYADFIGGALNNMDSVLEVAR